MNTQSLGAAANASSSQRQAQLKRYLPFLDWLLHYRTADLTGDILAGVIVAVMLVPQAMAYAMLAGLPPKVGLYASIAPLILYGLLGSSRTLAVGPVAIVSLLVAAGVTPLAEQGSAHYIQLAVTLAFLVGIIQLVMGLVRLGFLVNFLSHPVLVGFTNAAAIVIGFSQVKHLLGIKLPNTEHFHEQVIAVAQNIGGTHWITLGIGIGSIVILFFFRNRLAGLLQALGLPEAVVMPVTKSAPLVVVLLGTLLVGMLRLDISTGVKIVGEVPSGLPGLVLPTVDLSLWQLLLPTALAISFVGYMESISVAKSLARKRREKIDADQELVALGAANFGATFLGGYPVTGGLSRSVVNFVAGANTGLASMITALLIGLTVLFLTPLFYYLPNAVLAAIIVVAVTSLFDWKTTKHIFAYSKMDFAALATTFVTVLALGVEDGILVGAGLSLVLFIWRTSQPHIAVVGRIPGTEIYRNVRRHAVETWPEVIAMRIDESLYFANTNSLEAAILAELAEKPTAKYVILIGTAINVIDVSALEMLEALIRDLRANGVELHLAAIKGPVMDKLNAIGFVETIGVDHIHLSTHDAMMALGFVEKTVNRGGRSCRQTDGNETTVFPAPALGNIQRGSSLYSQNRTEPVWETSKSGCAEGQGI
ncbi:MAG: solute carrier family 26 protein [Caldilineaceae bacterium]|nr:solute carrier family 26 protein [Caldilineaceae bacterium]